MFSFDLWNTVKVLQKHGFFLNQPFAWFEFPKLYLKRVSGLRTLKGIELAATNHCNFKCVFCSASELHYPDMSYDQIKEVFDQAKKMGVCYVSLTGGEPLLHKDIEKILTLAWKKRLVVILITNGSMLDDEKIKMLKRCRVGIIQLSLYGSDNNSFEQFSGQNRYSFNTIVENANRARVEGLSVVIKVGPDQHSIDTGEFDRRIKWALDNNFFVDLSFPARCGKYAAKKDVPFDNRYLEEIRKYLAKPWVTNDTITSGKKRCCPAVREYVYIAANGDIWPCAFQPIKFGNIFIEGLNETTKQMLDSTIYYKKCYTVCMVGEDREWVDKYIQPALDYTKNHAIPALEHPQNILTDRPQAQKNIKKVYQKCPICGNNSSTIAARGRDFEFDNTTSDVFTYVTCNECGHFYLNPRPADTELDYIYPIEYHHYESLSENKIWSPVHILKSMAKGFRGTIEKKRVKKMLQSLIIDDNRLKVLDIGCATGAMLQTIKDLNPGAYLEGVEISEKACTIARKRGLTVRMGRFEETDYKKDSFNFIYCANIIEHLAEPREALMKMSDILEPLGHIVLITPETYSYCHRIFFDRYWGAYHFPRHWNLWNRVNFTRMSQSLGLQIVNVEPVICPTHWVWSIHHFLKDRTNLPKWIVESFNLNNPLWMGIATIIDIICSKIHHTSSMKITLTKLR